MVTEEIKEKQKDNEGKEMVISNTAEVCREDAKTKEETDRAEAERKAEEHRIAKAKKIFIIVATIVAVCIAFLLVLTKVIIPNNKYNAAVKLMDEGKYSEAILAFGDIYYYKDSADMFTVCQTALEDIDYNTAISLLNEGKIIEAYNRLVALYGYKDSATKAREIFGQYKIEKWKIAEVGDIVYLGTYEQDNDTSNGKEDIEWIVLAKENGKALIISRYCLDLQKYNSTYVNVTWEKCSLRAWLNGMFLNNAFSTDELKKIATTYINVKEDLNYNANFDNPTYDKVFLLSNTEVYMYLTTPESQRILLTDCVRAEGASRYSTWWLRSLGNTPASAEDTDRHGYVNNFGTSVDTIKCVRPALWINLDN